MRPAFLLEGNGRPRGGRPFFAAAGRETEKACLET